MEIDPEDDTLDRWVVWHYRYDPQRRQRRQVVVAAYDNSREQVRTMDELARQLQEEIAAELRDRREHVSGMQLLAGYAARQAAAHRVRRAIEHGVDPRAVLGEDQLPSNVGLFGWSADGGTVAVGGASGDASGDASGGASGGDPGGVASGGDPGGVPRTRRFGELPQGVSFVRESPRWAAAEVPAGLLRAHQVAEGVWGLLRVYAGSVRFVDEATGAGQDLGAGDEQVIPPVTPHHVEPGADAQMSVSFYR